MKKPLILIVVLFNFSLYGQLQVDQEFYPNGNLYWSGYKKTDTLSDGMTITNQFGFYRYWYETGQPKMEVVYKGRRKDDRYINMWRPDGIQILAAGTGQYYRVENLADVIDSTVYVVKDSILSTFSKYRRWPKDKRFDEFYLVSEGSSINGLLEGIVKFYGQKSHINSITTYKEDKKNGLYVLMDKESKIIEKGRYCDDKMCSEWQYFKRGLLEKKVEYVGGAMYGNYQEYFKNGKLKVKGQFGTERRMVKAKLFNPDTYEDLIMDIEREISIKQGDWIYYNRKGQVIRIEKCY